MLLLKDYSAIIKETYGSDQPYKWWTTLKSALFGVDLSVPPSVKPDGCITHSPLEKATLFADVFDSTVNRAMKNVIFLCHVFVSLG